MTATREHRNAARVELAIDIAAKAIDLASETYLGLAADLPDDFPVIDDQLHEARKCLKHLAELVV